MSRDNVMREFITQNYKVRISAEEEFDLDLSWDDTGKVKKGLESGLYIAFCAHVEVIHRQTGAVLGEDYLGNCVYESFDDFMDHRECAKQNREYAAQGIDGRCGSQFAGMISEAIRDARKNYSKMQLGQLRAV